MRASEAAVIEQRLRPLRYKGGHSILLECFREARPQAQPARAFVRMEPAPGDRFEVDWGHFGALDYSGDKPNCSRFPDEVQQAYPSPRSRPTPWPVSCTRWATPFASTPRISLPSPVPIATCSSST